MFIDSGKVISTWGKQPPVMTRREEFNKDAAKEEYKNLIVQGWSITEDWTKKESYGC